MKVYRKGSGEKYTPFDHFNMTTQVIFNPETGSSKANVTLTTLAKGSGSNDEIHENSDQLLYMIQGTMKIYAHDEMIYTVTEGDAVLVTAGDTHAVRNEDDQDVKFIAITVPPLDRTH
jgi:quercetin dioxygenase-like cupin family protein